MQQDAPGRRSVWVGVVAVSAAALGLGISMLLGLLGPLGPGSPNGGRPSAPPASARPAFELRTPVATGAGRPAESTGPAEPARRADEQQQPTALRVPAVDLDLPVRPVGVTGRGDMALPDDPRVLGWYRFGPVPGAAGSSVVAGHLDSTEFGVGPLVRLSGVTPGDRIRVTTTDGRDRRYVVTGVRRHDRRRLPTGLFSRSGPSRLRVVTCAGEYDAEAGGYQLNLVVTAKPE